MTKQIGLNDRIVYYDIIRIISHFALVMRHMFYVKFNDFFVLWLITNFYRSITPWIIPLLLMLSGAIFLDNKKNLTIDSLYKKNIKKLIIYFFIWSIIYIIFKFDFKNNLTPDSLLKSFFDGYFHLWYIPHAIAMYMFAPLLRKISDNKSYSIYICVVLILYCFLYYSINYKFISFPVFLQGSNYGFISLFVLMFFIGNMLNKYDISKKWRIFWYISAVISTFIIYFGTYFLSVKFGTSYDVLQSCDSPFAIIQGIAIFIFIKQKYKNIKYNNSKLRKLSCLSNACFGVYMVHPLIIDFFGQPGNTLPSIYFSPLIWIGISVLCFIVSYLIKKIPIIGKYIV